jgi:succinate-semialdehyde dehydrogenase/glutarate-semialdehyde dehydrogenase
LLNFSNYSCCLIGKNWIQATNAKRISVFNPATNEELGIVPDCGEADANLAAEEAASAAETWAQTPVEKREQIMLRAYNLILQKSNEVSKLITLEQGKPLAESIDEVLYAASFINWYAAEARRVYGSILPQNKTFRHNMVFREPIGPILVITPWNDPFAMVARKVAPAIAAGCSVVIMPAKETPFSAIAFARIMTESGIPPGVINLITTSKSKKISEILLKNKAIRHVTFTGSTDVGKKVAQLAGSLVKGTTMELGGHAPFVVFSDADLNKASEDLVIRKFRNAGQTCSSPNRIFLQKGIANDFLKLFLDKVRNIRTGNGMEPGIKMGPLINMRAIKKVENHIADAVALGAKIVAGGHRLGGKNSNFFEATALDGVEDEMIVAKEETFGPVAAFFRFQNIDDLLIKVNHPKYGLAGYVYTLNLHYAFLMFKALRCGFIGLNNSSPQSADVPMGGILESGFGREGGKWGIEEFLTTKYVSLEA